MISKIVISFLFSGFIYIYLKLKKKYLPKKYKKYQKLQNKNNNKNDKNDKNNKIKRIKQIDRNRYSKKKIPNNLDVIVIGSGIGGLSSAAFLSKLGYKVLVLEQHYIAGGCCHSFEEHGIEHETGIHYIGNASKRKRVLDFITDSPLNWCKMGSEDGNYVYDEIVIENKLYKFRAGEQNFINDMIKHFPNEKKAIIQYIQLVKKAATKDLFFKLKVIQNPWIAYCLSFFLGKEYYEFVTKSAYDTIKELTKNEMLISVLCSQFGDYGPTPKNASFFIHSSIVNHYLEGGYYPEGGSSQIAKKIIPTIEKGGGAVLVSKKVNKIIIKQNTAIGVEMENGDRIYAKQIISSAGIYNTFKKLITIPKITQHYNNIYKNIEHSECHVYLFVKLKGTPQELQLRSSNIWHWPDSDYDKMLDTFYKDPLKAPLPFFMGFSCAKDHSWNKRYPGYSNAIVLTMAKFKDFEQWKDEKCMHRSQEYKELKEKYAQRLLEEALFKFYPHLRDKVEAYDLATPLTSQFYLNSYNGESYGLQTNKYRYLQGYNLKPKTPIKNLFLTGQDICTIGFTGALMSGLLTTYSILGYGTLWDIITGRDLFKDLQNI